MPSFSPLPVPAVLVSLPLPPYSYLYSANPIHWSSVVPLSVSLVSSPAIPKHQANSSCASLVWNLLFLHTIPAQLCLFCIQTKQASALHVLGLQAICTSIKEVSCLKPESGTTLKVVLSKWATPCVDRLSGEASWEALKFFSNLCYVKGSR